MFLGVSDRPVMCAWASIRPGISVLPPTSMTVASRPSTAFGDTETMRPSFTRTLNDRCGSAKPSRRRLALVNSVGGIRNLSRDNTTRLDGPGGPPPVTGKAIHAANLGRGSVEVRCDERLVTARLEDVELRCRF